ncbi:hypothetical protein WJS89_10455 [Sphingomicrobium sp. XHP0235]|uniref:hypothetical protein n=1 Tax=Sphingomicrobium aquimarinum TaxID=3133971 RepID=UPI0031FE71AC
MCDGSTIMRAKQRIVREMLDERGISLKQVSHDSKISYSTLCSYFPGNERGSTPRDPAELPMGKFYKLCGHIPADILNVLLPDSMALVNAPDGVDYDDLSAACREYIDAKDAAHHPDSEDGRELGPNERKQLDSKVARIGGHK